MIELNFRKNRDLRRRVGYAAKSAVGAGLRKASPYAQKVLAFLMFFSSGNITAEKFDRNGMENGKNQTEQFSSTAGQTSASINSATAQTVFANLDACRETFGEDFTLDVSKMEFSMEDLALIKGKESPTAKKMLSEALKIKFKIPGVCTAHAKKLFTNMGWLKGMNKEDRMEFDRVVSAWELLPLLQSGKIGPLVEININPAEWESKTTPIPVVRCNEQGETRHAHIQVMNEGAVYGAGIQASPEYHVKKLKNGKRVRQKYGRPHFFVDRETLKKLTEEVTKMRDDVVLVGDPKTKTIHVVPLDNVSAKNGNTVEKSSTNAMSNKSSATPSKTTPLQYVLAQRGGIGI